MYNLPEMRADNAALWLAIRTEAERGGISGLPEALDFDRKPVPERIEAETVFTQVCGWPLQTIYAGQAVELGVPVYDDPYCLGPMHTGVFVVGRDARFRFIPDLRGCHFVFNSVHSNSGMNLPRRVIADLAHGRRFFGSVEETHSQPGNLDRVARGEAEATCVDCVTFAFYSRHRPEMASALRALAPTLPTPAIPFVTSAASDARLRAGLAAALRRVGTAAEWADVRARMLLRDIVPPEGVDYQMPCRYAAEAVEMGYPALY